MLNERCSIRSSELELSNILLVFGQGSLLLLVLLVLLVLLFSCLTSTNVILFGGEDKRLGAVGSAICFPIQRRETSLNAAHDTLGCLLLSSAIGWNHEGCFVKEIHLVKREHPCQPD